ncbi:MAG: CRISPR-associated endonuclease Cas3'' [Candidatus Dadabacteria bacterium]|nr:MAG: CRISPR-associated endonuclease Cas3'' [Candidatus Dadabacteria bacterium]
MTETHHDAAEPIAHLLRDPRSNNLRIHPLRGHLTDVANLASSFASDLLADQWGYQAGLWHDLGKYSEAFQNYLLGASRDYHTEELSDTPGRVDHSSAGAQHARNLLGPLLGDVLAFVIAGHHSGLLDAIGNEGSAALENRLRKQVEDWRNAPTDIRQLPEPARQRLLAQLKAIVERSQEPLAERHQESLFAISFFIRMLFSCLVDADFLDTERFMDPERAKSRASWPDDILERIDTLLTNHVKAISRRGTAIHRIRSEIYEACVNAAPSAPGFFSLTVPTGGGKTLSTLAFALRHALRYGMRRIVYVAPFTSIIEQNADVYREVVQPLTAEGLPSPVLEHHSALDIERETFASRLATENWDAPLIVTTAVQFYESLFAARTSRCRKLHNLSHAVVILDEAQKLPVDLLHPILSALKCLAGGYGATILLCTATQPAVAARSDFPAGLPNVREIIPDPAGLARKMKRVTVRSLNDLHEMKRSELVQALLPHEQVLCIANTRSTARELCLELRDNLDDVQSVQHLSAAMCPEHRCAVLADIRNRLANGAPCRVIATQVIEAGVDVDFPVVFRALAGLDSIAQAAGRCNREGIRDSGDVWIYRLEAQSRREGFLADTINAATQVLSAEDQIELLSPETVEQYFRLYFWQQRDRWDRYQIVRDLSQQGDDELPLLFQFRSVSERFRLIPDNGATVIIPWGERGADLVDQLRRMGANVPRNLLRKLQRFTVQIPQRWLDLYLKQGRVEQIAEHYPALVAANLDYDELLGISPPENVISWSADALIC